MARHGMRTEVKTVIIVLVERYICRASVLIVFDIIDSFTEMSNLAFTLTYIHCIHVHHHYM